MRKMFLLPVLGLALAGCNGQEQTYSATRGGTIALESIDGASDNSRNRLASAVAQQGAQRQIAVVSRSEPSPYRVKGYLSASGNQLTYVFDVFDTSNRRALRISGDDMLARTGNADMIDDATAARIAARSLDQMAVLFNPALRPAETPATASAATSAPTAVQQQDEPVSAPAPSAPGNAIAYAPTATPASVMTRGTTTLSVQAARLWGGLMCPATRPALILFVDGVFNQFTSPLCSC